jgi:DNA-binding response OmpR family regulator
MEEVLSRDGYEVVTADSGEMALKKLKSEPFDLALLDLNLPGIGGMGVLAELRRHAPDTVVIVLTAHASLETAVEALRQGAHDYLFKPCKTVELRESIKRGLLNRQKDLRQRGLLRQLEQHLSSSLEDLRATIIDENDEPPATSTAKVVKEKAETPENRFLEHGPLVVDTVRHVITVDKQSLELSPTEFDLLVYLISEAPRVIPPQELVREVQGYESDAWEASETVRYHIYRIRQKIKEVNKEMNIIRTVRGVGYTVGARD